MCGAWLSPLVSYLTVISPRIDRCRSQKYGYTPRWVSSTVAVAPLPASWWLNLPSRLSGVPEVTVCVMSSWLVKVTLLPAAASMGVGLNWKVWTVTPCGDCAAALPAPSASATATAATSLVPCHRVPIAASSVAPDRVLTQDLRRWALRGLVAHERTGRLRDEGSYFRTRGRDRIQRKLVGTIIRELERDAQILRFDEGDDGLEVIPVLARDAHLLLLDGGLHPDLGVLDEAHDLLGLLHGNAVLEGDALAHRPPRRRLGILDGQRVEVDA